MLSLGSCSTEWLSEMQLGRRREGGREGGVKAPWASSGTIAAQRHKPTLRHALVDVYSQL